MSKLTNKYGLPQEMVNWCEATNFKFTENSYSATTIIHHPTEILLQRRHDNEIETDVSDLLAVKVGSALHSFMEMFKVEGNIVEQKFKTEIKEGLYLSGVCDSYDSINHILRDWKTGTVWKYKFKDYRDWKMQAMIYIYLLEKEGYPVDKVEFWCFMKDWSARERRLANMKGDEYPQIGAFKYEFIPTLEDREYIAKYIDDWFNELIDLQKKADEELPYCGDINTWYSGDSFAVYKVKPNGDLYAKAERVFKTKDEAITYIDNATMGSFKIVERKGEYKKCQDYCSACQWCKHYKEVVNNA